LPACKRRAGGQKVGAGTYGAIAVILRIGMLDWQAKSQAQIRFWGCTVIHVYVKRIRYVLRTEVKDGQVQGPI
jgi:hypothetical protein